MEGRGVEQDLIQYVGQLELVIVPVKGWIINLAVTGLLYGPNDGMCLPTNYGEVVCTDVMTIDLAMVINGGRGCKVLLEPFIKSTCRFLDIPSLQSSLSHLYLYTPSLFCMMLSLSLRATRRFLVVLPPLKWTLAFPQTFLNLSLNPLVYGTVM